MDDSKPMHPALYRIYQFLAAIKAGLPAWAGGIGNHLTPADQALVASVLPTASQQQLFLDMTPNDRRHALAVARALQQIGYSDRALLQAALLHDVAKSLGQPVIHRVLIVLLEAFWPAALAWLSRSNSPGWWRQPFVVHAQHPHLGADWAKQAGCDPLAVSLIARHQELLPAKPARDDLALLAALQWADGMN
jgi:hypothetical protein